MKLFFHGRIPNARTANKSVGMDMKNVQAHDAEKHVLGQLRHLRV